MNFPITALFAGLLGFVFMYLSVLVIKARRKSSVGIGDGGDSHLQKMIRVHGNFTEYVPLCLILIFVAELNATPSWLLYVLGGLLVYGRIAHAFGVAKSTGVTWQRMSGMISTFLVLIALSALNLAMFASSHIGN